MIPFFDGKWDGRGEGASNVVVMKTARGAPVVVYG